MGDLLDREAANDTQCLVLTESAVIDFVYLDSRGGGMRIVILTLVIGLVLSVVACGSSSPKQGVIGGSVGPAGAAIFSQIEDNRSSCVFPPENRVKNADGTDFRAAIGANVEILEEAQCSDTPGKPYKVRVVGEGIEGWVSRNYIVVGK